MRRLFLKKDKINNKQKIYRYFYKHKQRVFF